MNEFLDVKDLARLLKVPPSWIYDRTRASNPNRLPHYKVGKYVRFSETEVMEYLKTMMARQEENN